MFLFVRRYLFAKKSHSVVNIITALSLVSISLPVAAVIILLSVFNGFGELVDQNNRAVDPDVTVVLARGNLFDIEDIDTDRLSAIEGVDAISFISEQTMLIEQGGRQAVVTVRGVDSSYLSVIPLDQSVTTGAYQVALGELDRMVLGNSLAYRLGVHNIVDKFINIYALKGSGFSSLLPMSNYTKRRVKLAGVYSADLQSEDRYVVTSLRAVQGLTSSEGRASQAIIAVAGGYDVDKVIRRVQEALGGNYLVKSRYDLNPMLYDIVEYEKWGVLFISLLIMLLATFTLIGALSMLIIEKRDNISTLRAMGGSWDFVRGIFFGEGVFISAVGVALGVVVGCSLTMMQKVFGLVKIPAKSFMVSDYPVQLLFTDVAIVVVMSLAISVLLSYVVVRQMIKNE